MMQYAGFPNEPLLLVSSSRGGNDDSISSSSDTSFRMGVLGKNDESVEKTSMLIVMAGKEGCEVNR